MTTADLLYKWAKRFASNDTFDISAADLREYNEDSITVFGNSNPTGAAFLSQKAGKTSFLLGTKLRDKTKLWLRFFSAGTLAAILPAPALALDRPAIAAPGAAFTLHASIGGPATGTAAIAEYTRQVSDGEHFQLVGADLDKATYPVYREGNFYATSVTTQDSQKAAVRLPKVGAAWDVALTWASTSAGISLPVVLNRATYTWGEDEAAEGLTITQYGRNLAHGNQRGGLSYLAVQPVGGGPVTLFTGTAATPYEASFLIQGLRKGTYRKWLHNGHGGDYGWSEASLLKVVDRQEHVMTHDFGVPVYLPLSASDGVANSQNIAKMFSTLSGNGGGCFETDNGDFPSSEFIYPQNNVKWQCRTAATGGRTNLTISGNWNPGDCMLASNSWTMGALDGITFFKPDTVNVAVDALLIFNGSRHIRLDNVGSTWKQPYTTVNVGGNAIPLNAQPLRITNSQYVFLKGCNQTGSGMHIGSRHNVGGGKSGVNRQIFIRNHTARLTNGADYTIYVLNTDGILIDNLDWQDLDPNSTDGLQRGAGRGPKFGGQGGSNQNAHVGRCNGHYLGPIFTGTNPFYDRNQGENFLWEGNPTTWKNYVVSATATTLTFAQPVLSRLADVQAELLAVDSPAAGVLPGLHLLGITKGRGLWQMAGIASVSGNTITLDRPLAVIPDATSYVQVGCFSRNNVVVDCTVSGKRNIVTDPDFGILCGINWFGGVWNSVADNLRSTNDRHGLITSMTTHADGEVDGCYFIEFRNSPPKDARWGQRFQACGHPGNLGWTYPVTALGAILVSNCQPTGSYVADVVYELPRDVAALSLWAAPPIDLLTIENQTSAAGLNEYRMASNPTNFPAIPVLPGAVANFAQLARQAQVLPTAPGVQLVAAADIGPLEPLPAGATIEPINGVLSYPGIDQAVLVWVDGAQETPLDRTPVAGATAPGTGGTNFTAGAGIDLTGNVISTTGYTDAQVDALLVPKISKQDADVRYGQLAIENTWQRDQIYSGIASFTSSYLPLRVQLSAFGIVVDNKGPIAVTVSTNAVQWSDGNVSGRFTLTGGKLVFSGAEIEVPDPTTAQGIATKAYVDRAVAAGGGGGGGTGTPTTGTSYTDTQAVTAVANALVSANSQHTGIKASVVNGLPTLTVAPPRQPFVSVHPVGTVTTGETPIVLSEWTGVYLNLTSLNLISTPEVKVNGAVATFPLTLNLGDILRITATVGGGGPGIVRLIPAP